MLIFRLKYFLLAAALFITEVVIALYVRDRFIRPYVGDFLVVILVYCFVRAFINCSVWQAATGSLLFAYFIELLQYFHFADWLGLGNNTIARTVIGYGFEWWDMLAYTLGILFVVLLERKKPGKPEKR